MIGHVAERAARIAGVDEVRLAVPDLPEDDVEPPVGAEVLDWFGEGAERAKEAMGEVDLHGLRPTFPQSEIVFLTADGVGEDFGRHDTGGIVFRNDLGEPIHVTPAVDRSTIYIRTETKLHAFR